MNEVAANVDQIMEQIRARIREKRGVDYDAQQIEALARAKLDTLLDPRSVHTDLLDRLRKLQPAYEPPQLPAYEFEDSTLYESHRGLLRTIRRLLNPILKLFFNPNPLISALNTQAKLNAMYAEREAKRDATRQAGEQLFYQLLHNLLMEITQAGVEIKNLRMRVESMGGRLEFNERRARAIEGAVMFPPSPDDRGERADRDRGDRSANRAHAQSPQAQPQTSQPTPSQPPAPAAQGGGGQGAQAPGGPGDGSSQRSRRRRRRRGRRGGGAGAPSTGPGQPQAAALSNAAPGSDAAGAGEPPARDDLENFSGAAAHPSEDDDREPESGGHDSDSSDAGPDDPQ